MTQEPRWLTEARKHLGEREIKGRQHNPFIVSLWTLIHAGFSDDETPWCAGFVGGMLEKCGIRSSRSAVARSYLTWGVKLDKPVTGCIVVFQRGKVNGHVGFYIGRATSGAIRVLGGNQGDSVSIAAYSQALLLGYRWPKGEPLPGAPSVLSPAPLPPAKPAVPPPPDVETSEPAPPATGLSAKVQHWLNLGATAAGTFLTALMAGDWRAVSAVMAAGLIVFGIIWFTTMRRGKRR